MTSARWARAGVLLFTLVAAAAAVPRRPGVAHAQEEPAAPEAAAEQEVRAALEHARAVASAGGGVAYADLWDAATMVDDVLASPDLAALSQEKKVLLGMGMRLGIRAGFANDPTVMAYERMDIREVHVTGDRAVAVIRGWDADDLGLGWRLWLVGKPDGWRLCDAEEMSQGIRVSRLLLAAVADSIDGDGTPEWVRRIAQLTAAANATATADWENAERLLAGMDDVTFPPDFDAMRAMLHGIVALQLYGDAEATLSRVAEMDRVFPASVAGELIRGRALLELGRPAEVIPGIDHYLAVTGPDSTALQLRGEALEALGRHKEALQALREASADAPRDADVLGVWMDIADGRELREPLRVFRMLRNPESVFERIVVLLRNAGDQEALTGLLDAFARIRPESLDLAYWRALVRKCRARAFIARGQALEGYAELGAPAFAELAQRLYEGLDGEVLMKLATTHAKAQPGDELNVIVRLHALFLTGAHEEALQHFTAHEDELVARQDYAVYDSAFRAGLRSGDMTAAVYIAELARDEIDDPFPLAVVRLAAGERDAAEQSVRTCLDGGFAARDFLVDPDAAKALEQESLEELRATLEELAAD